jgi:hypothetical protein
MRMRPRTLVPLAAVTVHNPEALSNVAPVTCTGITGELEPEPLLSSPLQLERSMGLCELRNYGVLHNAGRTGQLATQL